jgi:hypothetical protein
VEETEKKSQELGLIQDECGNGFKKEFEGN